MHDSSDEEETAYLNTLFGNQSKKSFPISESRGLSISDSELEYSNESFTTRPKGFEKFANVELSSVERIPYDIDGTCGYKVPFDASKPRMLAVKDGRPWGPDNCTNWRGYK